MFVTLPDKPMPPAYQHADCRFVFRSLGAGESCSLIGIGSVGKSNLLQNLTRDDVKAHHLADEAAPYLLTVYLDPHTLVHLRGAALEQAGDLWPGYELMLSRLLRTVRHIDAVQRQESGEKGRRRRGSEVSSMKAPGEPSLLDKVESAVYGINSSDPVTRQSGLRHLEEAVYAVLADDDRWRVAFLLDEISDFASLPALFFQSLRGLRDQFKGRVAFVTTSRAPLDALLDGLSGGTRSAMKEFTELFRDHTRYISPLDAESAAAVVDRFIARYEADFNIYKKGETFLKRQVYALTGGHVGLLRRSFQPAVQYLIDGEQGDLAAYLLRNPSVVRECETIIGSLSESERRVFYIAIKENRVEDERVWAGLFEKHIVTDGEDGAAFRLPLLGQYALANPDVLVGGASLR